MKKRLLATLLTMIMIFSMSSTAVFAEESNESTIPENATRHTIELTLQPEDVYTGNIISGESATPFVWGDPSLSMADNHVAYTSSFYLSDKYFAYEMQGFLEGNPSTSEGYSVGLEYVGGSIISSMSGYADGGVYKNDWITINVDGNYRFKVTNATDYVLTVYLTYYSWN